jgi:hypothetical protein
MNLDRRMDEEYIDSLRLNIIQLFSCVLLGIEGSAKIEQNIEKIVIMVRKVIEEDTRKRCVRECINIVGDLVSVYGRRDGLEGIWVDEFVNKWGNCGDKSIEDSVRRAMRNIGT